MVSKHWFSALAVEISDDFLERRSRAITAVSSKWRKINSNDSALQKADQIVQGLLALAGAGEIPADLRQELGGALNKESPTFEDTGAATFELTVTAAAAACEYLDRDGQNGAARVFSEAIAGALPFIPQPADPRLNDLWSELAERVRQVSTVARISRARKPIPNTAGEELNAIAALSANAELDREEINLLWWTLNDWSELAHAKLSGLSAASYVVVGPIELAALMIQPAGQAHQDLSFRNLSEPDAPLKLGDLAGVADLKPKVRHALSNGLSAIQSYPRAFPILGGLVKDDEAAAEAHWKTLGFNSELSMPARRWAAMTLQELSLVRSLGISIRRDVDYAA